MPETKRGLYFTSDLRPAYYDDFHCLKADCRLNCCRDDWRIAFGRKDYLTVKKQKGSQELNRRLDHCLRRIRKDVDEEYRYGEFVLKDGVCPLLGEDCLCMLQVEKGFHVLPFVCRTFPRTERYSPSGYLERSLSPACEGVLELLWDLLDGVDFRSDPLPKDKRTIKTFSQSTPLISHFQDIRSRCIDFLQDRRFTLPERILLMGLALRELADGETDIPRWLERCGALAESGAAAGMLEQVEERKALPIFVSQVVDTLSSRKNWCSDLDILRREILSWLGVRQEAAQRHIELGPYRRARERYTECLGERDYFLENLMVCVFFHLGLPRMETEGDLWKSYVNFCNLYSMYRFLVVMSCREGVEDCKAELFRLLVHASRGLIHNPQRQTALRDELFQNDSATLPHMAILLCG